MTTSDYGKDEDSVQSLLKKLEGIERDLSGFENTIDNLKRLSRGLIERHHFDSKNIAHKQADIEVKFKELQKLKNLRLQRLTESEKFYKFSRQADEVIEWIGDQTTVNPEMLVFSFNLDISYFLEYILFFFYITLRNNITKGTKIKLILNII